jgi:DNA-binding MarR family transcriptional regulator
MKSDTDNYLKYWRVIREFVKVRYNLTQADLDMLLFLYSEKYFGQDKFKEYDLLLQWSTDRFHRLRKDGWIEKFRNQVAGRKALYRLTIKSTRMIQSVYRKLNGEEIPVSPSSNKIFRKNVPYTHKIYKDMIIEMNNTIKQQRHRAPE